MGIVNQHPDTTELEQFARGALSAELQSAIEAHLSDCPACQERVAASDTDDLVDLLRRAHSRSGAHTAGTAPETESGSHTSAPNTGELLPPKGGYPSVTPDRSADLLPEALVKRSRYLVRRLLGRGGMGAVYEAEHRLLNRPVALKVINPAFTASPAAVERFRREVRAVARLAHPNIVAAYDAEEIEGTHFLVMEYVPGTSLARLVKDRGALPVTEACEYVRQAACGLHHAHEQGIVHRDVKPDNLLRGADGRIKVVDFGVAALATERGAGLTDERGVMGTPEFMAPEQAEDARRADTRSDIYSLGCTLFYLLTGRTPYPADTALRKILAHREQPIPSLAPFRWDVPPELARVLERMLAKRPEDRFATPGEVAAALLPFSQLPPAVPGPVATETPPAQLPTRPPERPRRQRRMLVALALVLLFGAGSAGAVVYRIQTDRGELVITTESDDVEVTVKQGGEVVEIIDTKTNKRITLRSGAYELELKGAEGLKLDIDKATLTRGETVVAKLERVPKPTTPGVPVVPVAPVAPRTPGGGKRPSAPAGDLELVWKNTDWAPDGVNTMNFSPDGTRLAVSGGARGAYLTRVYNVGTGDLELTLGGVLSVFAPDGKSIWTTGAQTFRRYDARTGSLIEKFGEQPGAVWQMKLSPDGVRALVHSSLGTIYLWDLVGKKELKQWDGTRRGAWFFTPDPNVLYGWNGTPIPNRHGFWDLGRDEFRPGLVGPLSAFEHSFLPGGKQVVMNEGQKLYVIDLDGEKVVREIDLGEGLGNGAREGVVSCGGRYYGDVTRDGSWLGVWDIQTGAFLGGVESTLSPKHQRLALAPDGRHFAAGDDRGGLYVYRVPGAAKK